MNPHSEYTKKLRTADEAVKTVKSRDWVDYGFGGCQPVALDAALARRKGELNDITIRGALALAPRKAIEADPQREVFTYASWHFSGYERRLHDRNLCNYIPMIFRNKPVYYRQDLLVDVAMLMVSPMNKHGYFSFSISNSAARAILDVARVVIVEVNENLPVALGGREECVHISEVDFVVQGDNEPIAELPAAASDDLDRKVAGLIVEEIADGSTIQLGIGGMPNAVGKLIAASDVRDLGMHTEMLVDAYLEMYKNGRLNNRCKTVDRDKGVWAFSLGSRELYDWIDDNPGLASCPVDYTNNPDVIAGIDNFVSVNNCVEVDLFGQVSSESSGTRHISGTGGQLDFVTGAYRSRGGKSFICFRSSYENKKSGRISSRVVPTLPPGSIVTVPRTQTHYLVSEWGKVNLAGCSTWERAERIISIAHPDFRDELSAKAAEMNIWRRSNRK